MIKSLNRVMLFIVIGRIIEGIALIMLKPHIYDIWKYISG